MKNDLFQIRMMQLILAVISVVAISPVWAQDSYPARPVHMIVSSSPGGGTDATARIIAPKLTELLGQQIVVENRPGASSQIGAENVARAAPDGYTLLMTASSLVVVQSTYRKPRINPFKELAPITQVVVVPQMLAAHASIPAKNLKELIAFLKARPGKVDYSAGNYGGHPHVTMALFLTMAKLDALFVPYKSGNAGLTDALSGHVPLMLGNVLAALPHVRAGRLRAYGVTSPKRAVLVPDIPTIAEAGVPGYESEQWFGVLAPAATPRPILNRLHRDLLRVIQDEQTKQRFLADGGEATWSKSPEEFGTFIQVENVKWAKVVKEAGITPQ
jgi:tripartite-type tricarboxylate transporter receptor subunit TctC